MVSFSFDDTHWQLEESVGVDHVEKMEIMPLECYCDDEGAPWRHKGPFPTIHAAILSCANVEETVKEFQKCFRCKRIAYCSKKVPNERLDASQKFWFSAILLLAPSISTGHRRLLGKAYKCCYLAGGLRKVPYRNCAELTRGRVLE